MADYAQMQFGRILREVNAARPRPIEVPRDPNLRSGSGAPHAPETAPPVDSDASANDYPFQALCDRCGLGTVVAERFGHMLCAQCLDSEEEDDHTAPRDLR